MNSEIIGKPTDRDYGVVFTKPVEDFIKKQLPFVREVIFEETGKFHEAGKPILKTRIVFEGETYKEKRVRKSVEKRLGFLLPVSVLTYSNVINPYGASVVHSFSRIQNRLELQMETIGILRHPSQLYESFTYLLIGIWMYILWNKHRIDLRPGSLLGLFLMVAFLGRFFLENFKENQVAFEAQFSINLGQILSIPLFVYGVYVFFRNFKSNSYS